MINKDAPFPQANDFEKVIAVLNVEDEAALKDYSRMSVYLSDVTDRQVDYYISACMYLGLISKEKVFTSKGKELRNKVGIDQLSSLIQTVISDECFGIVYFKQKLLGLSLDNSEVEDVMREYIDFESDAMYKRRASTVSSWIKWINEHEE